jgi:large subunit ribosomal protein L24
MTQAKFKIKKGDKVVVITGKDKGKSGEVLSVLRERSRLVVAGINMVKRHKKPGRMGEQGGIIAQESSIHISNVAHIDPKSSKPTRAGFRLLESGEKVRVAKKSGEVIA